MKKKEIKEKNIGYTAYNQIHTGIRKSIKNLLKYIPNNKENDD